MQILQTIEEIIKREFLITSKGGNYFLSEPTVPNYPRTNIKQKGKMLIYSFDLQDSNTTVFPIFNDRKKNLTKICDYLIFYPKDNTLFTFICDLKTSQSSAKKQVEAGWVLAEYIINMARKELKFIDVNLEFRAFVFSRSNRSKFASSIKKEKWVELADSKLKNKLLKAGSTVFLDNHCY